MTAPTRRRDEMSIEERVAYLEGRMEDHGRQTGELQAAVRESRDEGRRSFEAVDGQFVTLRDGMGRRFEAVDGQLVGLRGDMGRRFDAVDARFIAVEKEVRTRFDSLDRLFAEQRQKCDRQFTWLVAIFMTGIVGILTSFLRPG